MKTNVRRFCFPTQAGEAARLAGRLKEKALIVAGGTRHTRSLDPRVETIIDISDLPLCQVKVGHGDLSIGALCTIDELEKSPVAAKWARGVIAKTAGFGSNAPARAMGTVGGNVVRAHPYNNLPPVFLALGAKAVLHDGARQKSVDFSELLQPELMRQLGRKYLLTEILLPAKTKNWAAASLRLAKTKTDWESFANVVVALEIKGGAIRQAAVAVGALLPRATRLPRTENGLLGRAAGEETARWAGDMVLRELVELDGSAAKAYGREMAGVLTRRALLEAFQG